MSRSDVSPSEMKRLTDISDSGLEAMRAGDVPVGEAESARLAAFVRDLETAFPDRSTERLEAAHVAAMLGAAHLATDKGESALQPMSNARGPAARVSGLPKSWRERIAMNIRTAWASRTVRTAVAAIAMVLAFAGVAVAGVLPAPLQNAVADTAKTIGLELPGGTDEIEAGAIGQVGQSANSEDLDLDDQGEVDVDVEDQDDADDADEADESDDADDADEADEADDADESDDADDADEADEADDADEADEADDADEADEADDADEDDALDSRSEGSDDRDSDD